MFDFQQLVSDLREEKLMPSVPVKGNQVELLKISDKIFKNMPVRRMANGLFCKMRERIILLKGLKS